MRSCPICAGTSFVEIEYRAPTFSCPAYECRACHAIALDEESARSDVERASVRMAVKVRAGLASGTYERVLGGSATPTMIDAIRGKRSLAS
jgi:hypothetical protein